MASVDEQRPSQTDDLTNPVDKFWSLYLGYAEAEDLIRMETWKGNTDGILVFTGLFAATVAAFVIESYKQLSPDYDSDSAHILRQMLKHMRNETGAVVLPPSPPSDNFSPPATAVFVNTLWFLSLIVSLCCAMSAALVQQWGRAYMQDVQRHRSLAKRGPVNVLLRMGVESFGLSRVPGYILSLLHLAVGLFLTGLAVFLIDLDAIVASACVMAISLAGIVYLALSLAPAIIPHCPYHTPLTPLASSILRLAISITFLIQRGLRWLWSAFYRTTSASAFWRVEPSTTKGSYRFTEIHDEAVPLTERIEAIVPTRDSALKITTPSTAVLKFALGRTLEHVDEFHEFSSFFVGLSAILALQPPGGHTRDERELVRYLSNDLRIFEKLSAYVKHPGPASPAGHHFRHRLSVALLAGRRLFAGHLEHSPQDILDDFSDYQRRKFLSHSRLAFFGVLTLGARHPDPAARLIARAHALTLCCTVYRMIHALGRGSNPSWTASGTRACAVALQFLRGVVRPLQIHDAECCRERLHDDGDGEIERPSIRGDTLISHLSASSVFGFLVAVLGEPLEAIEQDSTVWMTCLQDLMIDKLPNVESAGPHPQPLNLAFTKLFVDAGLEAWLAPGSSFASPPIDAPDAEALRRFPRLLEAMRCLAWAVIPWSSEPTVLLKTPGPSRSTTYSTIHSMHLRHVTEQDEDGNSSPPMSPRSAFQQIDVSPSQSFADTLPWNLWFASTPDAALTYDSSSVPLLGDGGGGGVEDSGGDMPLEDRGGNRRSTRYSMILWGRPGRKQSKDSRRKSLPMDVHV